MSDWRPFDPSRCELERVQQERELNTCNLHRDCDAADEVVRLAGGRRVRPVVGGPFTSFAAVHCSVEDCEDCFGC